MLPIINDHKQPNLSKTEKAIAVQQANFDTLHFLLQGLQKQVAGLCLHLKVAPNDLVINTHKEEVFRFLEEAQKAQELILKAQQRDNTLTAQEQEVWDAHNEADKSS